MFRESQIIGPYILIGKLGRGGFGEVWLAERQGKFVTTKVAVKLPLDEQVDHEAIRHEATLWEQASGHPNVLPIIEADEYNGQIVIVSEYAPDGSLEQLLRINGKLPVKQAVEMTVGILNGLEFLHFRNIIHRDLKPANILLQGATPRLTDFGISRAMRTTMASRSQHISGTFAYMSPEALDGKRNVQTDIWAVGVNLYQLLTGELPFPQKEPSMLFPAIIMREPEPLPDFVPPELKKIIAKSLEKNPENRYQHSAAMREDLRSFLSRSQQPDHAPTKIFNQPTSQETQTDYLWTAPPITHQETKETQVKTTNYNSPESQQTRLKPIFPPPTAAAQTTPIPIQPTQASPLQSEIAPKLLPTVARKLGNATYKAKGNNDFNKSFFIVVGILFVLLLIWLIGGGIIKLLILTSILMLSNISF